MNAARRKQIAELQERVAQLQADVEVVQQDEQQYLDDMPESLQEAERGQASQMALDSLDSAIASLTDACDELGAIE